MANLKKRPKSTRNERQLMEMLEEILDNSSDPNAITGEYDTLYGKARQLLNRIKLSQLKRKRAVGVPRG